MAKVEIHIRAQAFHSHIGGEYRAGSVQFVEPEEAAELVKAGVANYARPQLGVRNAMAVGPAADTPEQAAQRLAEARAADKARKAAEKEAAKAQEAAEKEAAKAAKAAEKEAAKAAKAAEKEAAKAQESPTPNGEQQPTADEGANQEGEPPKEA